MLNLSLVMTTLRIYFTINRSVMEGKVAAVAVNFLLLRQIHANTRNKACCKAPAKIITMNVSGGKSQDSPSPH